MSKNLSNFYKISSSSVQDKIKSIIRRSPFFTNQFKHYGIDPKELWRLKIVVGELDGKYAEYKDDKITINESLFKNKNIEDIMHYVAHELTHWLIHLKEENNYFADPEEVSGIKWAIAHEVARGQGYDCIFETFFPLVKDHFKNADEAKSFLIRMLKSAKKLAKC